MRIKKERKRDAFLLKESESVRIFGDYIVPYLFGEAKPNPNPKVVFVGAQPGAGKTPLFRHLVHEELKRNNSVVEIVGDDLRAFHPQYSTLLADDDESAAFYTDLDSARWIEMAIKYASENVGCSVGIETTLRRREAISATCVQLRKCDYKTQLNVLLIHQLLSRLGIIERYLAQLRDTGTGRFTLREAHDIAYNAIPNTVEQLIDGRYIDEVRLFRRGGVMVAGWTLNEQEKNQVRNQVTSTLNDNRDHMQADDVDYLRKTLPEIDRLVRETGKQFLIENFESIYRDFLTLCELEKL